MDLVKIKYYFGKILTKRQFEIFYNFWKSYKKIKHSIMIILNYLIFFIPNLILRCKNKYIFVIYGWGIGDMLVLTSVIEHFSKKGKVCIITSNSEIFANLDAKLFVPKSFFLRRVTKLLNYSKHSNIIGISELPSDIKKNPRHLREILLSGRKDIYKEVKDVPRNPKVVFSEEEVKSFSKKYKKMLNKDYGIIISGSYRGGLCVVKNWGAKNFQKVVDNTKHKILWVQTGTKNEPKLDDIFLDVRGKTTLRELFYLVSKAKVVVTVEGMLTYLSSAFGIPCITTYSGYHNPKVSKYSNVVQVQPNPIPKCAYCWTSPCMSNDYLICLKNISHQKVVEEVLKKIK